ncbi:ribonucleoside-diphosphate reductase subunit alpha [Coraliomargarita akajimensis]|uniref:Ribonucleoside-diphosphate reductase n=1 Tax=Coraliomargarita akajimensis (strain DSM 45221 / IAM 15411 / JCM 23193 / KCTC 12865 / 04OKA010-24) TaxID=583355 RepID=D5EJ98_CORAD|nr:ribonucleoside-diphosphate reductase subunit alpha [Coraliomargarita akajimensis]ADE54497.1 ribonucleoside-diphosphate reductase, alpha subunit [Coraliomargarita akajimensis DSM 45221]
MIQKISFEEDLELKRFATTPKDKKPRFDWRGVITEDSFQRPEIKIAANGGERDFDLAEIADTIGAALTDLLLSRQENDIFTDHNQKFVATVAESVGKVLAEQIEQGRELKLSAHDIDLLIEKALIENDAHDVAKSLVFARNHGNESLERPPVSIRLIRRNGQVVPWSESKIEIAVRKSFLSLHLDSGPAMDVARAVTDRLNNSGQAFINIEDVQDTVQEELMRQGHFKVAESYILYRAHRTRLRDESGETEVDETQQESMIVVTEENGENTFWDGVDLKRRIEFATIGLELTLSNDEIETELRRSLYPEMKREDLQKTIILNAKALIERDADFARFAGRVLLSYIYEEVLDWDIVRDGVEQLKEAHRRGLKTYLKRAVEIERVHPKLLEYDLKRLSEALDPSADLDFDYLGVQTLYDRYLIVDKTAKKHRRLEVPQFFWIRVAMGLFHAEKEDREGYVISLYNLYKSRRFCSSTPTLFNSGTLHSQLSSCYLYKVDDSIESIMHRGIADNAFLSKWAGGLGGSWTAVRGTGGFIKGTNGESQGVIPFLKLHNDQLVAVNQGGKRRGSGCAYLETWHNDIHDFLELRKNTGDDRRRTHDMNTANWIPDLFMKRMEARQDWTLFRSNETPDLHDLYGKAFEDRYCEYEAMAERGELFGKKVPAIELWKSMLRMIFETGHPWITFKDPCNVRSPQDHAGVIHSSNLCTEITLNTSDEETAVCNLGSVVLDSHLDKDGNLDHEKLRETVSIAVRALDNVIDINFYPTEAAKTANSRHRPIGLGVMGLQNALFVKDIAFASQAAVEFNDEFMEAIAYYAYEASSDLAAEHGTYSTYKGSKWDRGLMPQDTLDMLQSERGEEVVVPRAGKMDWNPLRAKIAKQGMRNSNVLAIAPTATISNIMGTSPCIEPTYKNLFVKSNLSGDFIVLNGHLVRDLKSRGLWDQDMLDQLKYFDGELNAIDGIPADLREKYKTAFTIEYQYFIDAAARRQKWIDQSQSVNLFLAEPDIKTLSHMYRDAWRKGLKTTYYLRTLGASNIEKATVSVKKEVRGRAGDATPAKKEYTDAEVKACSLEAMMNGGECEACQ